MESTAAPLPAPPATTAETGEKGLKKDAIGFLDGLSIGLASTAPAYSLAAVIGSIVVAVGIHAPACCCCPSCRCSSSPRPSTT